MQSGDLKQQLQSCSNKSLQTTDFSIGHRGALLKFPEHSRESYSAAAKQGAGFIECDIQVTSDKELVCRHSACDLQNTTNILDTLLVNKCTQDSVIKCCVADFTLAELKSLKAKNKDKDNYGELMSHADSIDLIHSLGRKFIPEIKAVQRKTLMTDTELLGKVINEYHLHSIEPANVWIQSGDPGIVQEILKSGSAYTANFVFLDYRYSTQKDYIPSIENFKYLRSQGIENIAPPMYQLLSLDENQKIVPSSYAVYAKEAGLNIYTWTLERSGHLIKDMKNGQGSTFYYQNILPAIKMDGDTYKVLDVLARDVGIKGIFSDWPETVTYYANCMGLE